MRITALVLLLACFQAPLDAQTDWSQYTTYPNPEEVVDAYFSIKPELAILETWELSFARCPEGWAVVRQKIDATGNLEPSDTAWVWSLENKDYINGFSRPKKIIENGMDEPKKPWESFIAKIQQDPEYEQSLFCGYPACNEDAIKVLENQKNLPPKMLNALARAYSHTVANWMGFTSTPSADISGYFESFNKREIQESFITQIIDYETKTSATYAKLAKLNGQFETPIGNIHLKMSNEQVHTWQLLEMLQRPIEAKKFVLAELYDEYIIDFAKNLLSSCAYGSILFTWGDNDTYPLLYIQENQAYRKDVTIVNLSLVRHPAYVFWLRKLLPHEKRVASTLDEFHYAKGSYDVIPVTKVEDQTDLEAFLDDLQNGYESKYKPEGFNKYIYFPGQNFFFDLDVEKLKKVYSGLKLEGNRMVGRIRDAAMLKDLLFFLDVVQENIADMPIYISSGVPLSRLPFDEFCFRMEGLAYRLLPAPDRSYHKLSVDKTNKFLVCNKRNLWTRHGTNYSIFSMYFAAYVNAAKFYYHANENAKGLELLERFEKSFPQSYFKDEDVWESYHKLYNLLN